MKMTKAILGVACCAVVLTVQAKEYVYYNLADWVSERLGSREEMYKCASANSVASGSSVTRLFNGICWTNVTTAAAHYSAGRSPSAADPVTITFVIPEAAAATAEDVPKVTRLRICRNSCINTCWQCAPDSFDILGRNSDDDEWQPILEVRKNYWLRSNGQTSPVNTVMQFDLPAVRFRQYRMSVYKTVQNNPLSLDQLEFLCPDETAPNVVRVAPGGTGDGSSWNSPASLASAVAAAGAGDEIWVKAGDYALGATLTVPTACSILGGFSGGEAAKSERVPGARSVLDATGVDTGVLITANGHDDCILENLAITNATKHGLEVGLPSAAAGVAAAGAGLHARNCWIYHNGVSLVNEALLGRGVRSFAPRGVPVEFVDSVIEANCDRRTGNIMTGSAGHGIYAEHTFLRLVNTAFLDNGIPATVLAGAPGRSSTHGAAIDLVGGNLFVSNCLFRGNLPIANGTGDGHVIVLENAQYGTSRIVGTRFVGNGYRPYSSTSTGSGGGSSVLSIGGATDLPEIEIDRCTFAYNVGLCCACINQTAGTLKIRNSIFYGNYVVGDALTAADLYLSASATGDVDYTLFAEKTTDFASGANLDLREHCVFGDPLFRTPRAEVELQLVTAPVDYPKLKAPARFNPAFDLSTLDVHLQDSLSPAIDKGDPDEPVGDEPSPNGGRLNLGAYAGTAEAAKTAQAVPVVDTCTVTFGSDYTRPVLDLTLKPGAEDFRSTVTVYYGYERQDGSVGWDHADVLTEDLHPGASLGTGARYYLEANRTCYWRVVISAPGGSATVEGPDQGVSTGSVPPPYYGLGLGADWIHVWAGAKGSGDGSDWLNACTNIASALALETESRTNFAICGTVHVNTSNPLTYRPVRLVGGYAAGATDPAVREGPAAVIDGENAYDCFKTAASTGETVLDGLTFANGYSQGLVKSGAGALTVRGCRFTHNGYRDATITGRGISASGAASVVVTNCVFDGNQIPAIDTQSTAVGAAGSFSGLKRLVIADTAFVTNGFAHITTRPPSRGATGGIVLNVSDTPTEIRRCRFVGNCFPLHGDNGLLGAVVFAGASPVTAENCLFSGNEGVPYADAWTTFVNGGALVLNLKAGTAATIDKCTFAYNVVNRSAAAGLQVVGGDVTVVNSLFFDNLVTTNAEAGTYGGDLTVNGANARVNVLYSRLTSLQTPFVAVVGDGTLTFGDGVTTGDPLFVSPLSEFEAAVESHRITGGSSSGNVNNYFKSADAAVFDLHLRSKYGYVDEREPGRTIFTDGYSPAIDGGRPHDDFSQEPSPNGHRVDLGFYGNTPWTSRSLRKGLLIFVW